MKKAKAVEKSWTKYQGIEARVGTKAGWFEIRVTKADGSIVKMIGRKVDRFWSEEDPAKEL